MPKKNKNNRGKLRARLSNEVMEVFHQNGSKPMNYKQVAKLLGIRDPHSRQLIIEVLMEMQSKGKLIEEGIGKYRLKLRKVFLEGIVDMNRSGSAYVITDASDRDIM